MREIKFRAWDNHNKVMHENVHLLDSLNEKIKRDNWNVLQYTGLKDKNGTEIYEGDIVELITYNNSPNYRGNNPSEVYPRPIQLVEYYEGKFISYTPKKEKQPLKNYGFGELRDVGNWKYEVIGNIHSNPELLK